MLPLQIWEPHRLSRLPDLPGKPPPRSNSHIQSLFPELSDVDCGIDRPAIQAEDFCRLVGEPGFPHLPAPELAHGAETSGGHLPKAYRFACDGGDLRHKAHRRFGSLTFADVPDHGKNQSALLGFQRAEHDVYWKLASVLAASIEFQSGPHRPQAGIGAVVLTVFGMRALESFGD